jgi:hypothetical protein
MRLNKQDEAALRQPDTKSVSVELTPELKVKFNKIAKKLIDLLMIETTGPLEAYMLLRFALNSFEDVYNIRGAVIIEKDDVSKGGN